MWHIYFYYLKQIKFSSFFKQRKVAYGTRDGKIVKANLNKHAAFKF